MDTFLSIICINHGFRLGSSFEKKNQRKDPTWNENSNIGSGYQDYNVAGGSPTGRRKLEILIYLGLGLAICKIYSK